MAKERGSITIFAAMTFMLVLQVIFTLLEGARIVESRKIAKMGADAGMESVFAEYCSPLWENYHILGYDLGDSSGELCLSQIYEQFQEITSDNYETDAHVLGASRKDLLKLRFSGNAFERYTLLTDYEGRIFEDAIAAYMKDTLAYQKLEKLKEQYEKIKGIEDSGLYDDGKIDHALEEIKNAASEEETDTEGAKVRVVSTGEKKLVCLSAEKKSPEDVDNPLETVKMVQKTGILKLVLPPGALVSAKETDLSNSVSKRECREGVNPAVPAAAVYSKMLYQQYLMNYMSCYTNSKDAHAFSYEMEYIICGKSKDEENLKGTIHRLLTIREAANMSYLMSDTAKQAEASALAAAIAGASLNPGVIEVIKIGILAAWAYCESVLDLRTLLAGEKIPIIKTSATWTAQLSNIGMLLSGTAKAKPAETGLSYQDYLGTILLLENMKKSAYRAMDVMELTVRKKTGYEKFCIDNLMVNMELTVNYEYKGLFLGFVTLLHQHMNKNVCVKTEYDYYKTKVTIRKVARIEPPPPI